MPHSLQPLINNIARVIVGKDNLIELVVTCLLSEGHVLLEDVPGTGKTMLARALAQSISGAFSRVQGTSDLMPSDITGSSIYNPKNQAFEFREGPVFTNILLMDEINRATPRAQSALLEAMAERKVSVDGHTYGLPPLFLVLATMNPLDSAGTYVLPEAQLDRFAMKLSVGYLSAEAEAKMVVAQAAGHPVESLQPVLTAEAVLAAQRAVRQVHLSPAVVRYGVALVGATRQHPLIRLGAGPRGTLNLLHAAQALAYLRGDDFVRPEQVQALVQPVLAHRLRLVTGAAASETDVAAVLKSIVSTLPVPV